MMSTSRALRCVLIPACAALGLSASIGHAQVFANAAPILIRDGISPTYPSTIAVSGVTEPIGNMTVRLQNVSHTWAGDIVVALAAIQELKAQHDAELAATHTIYKARFQAQQQQLDDLARRLDALEGAKD